jgi:CRP/FNR family cyclic AMP-dependent transcriptional regulator
MLRKVSLFAHLDEKTLGRLEGIAVKRVYPKNTILISKGDVSDHLFVVIRGKLKVMLPDESGKEIVLSLLGEGGLLRGNCSD